MFGELLLQPDLKVTPQRVQLARTRQTGIFGSLLKRILVVELALTYLRVGFEFGLSFSFGVGVGIHMALPPLVASK